MKYKIHFIQGFHILMSFFFFLREHFDVIVNNSYKYLKMNYYTIKFNKILYSD